MKSRIKNRLKKLSILLVFWILLIFSYDRFYLNFPQRFDVYQCVLQSEVNEIYRVIGPPEREVGFKYRNWFFGPMYIDLEVLKPNPNTDRIRGDKTRLRQDDVHLSSIDCNAKL